jgi:iron complex transport system permease protein
MDPIDPNPIDSINPDQINPIEEYRRARRRSYLMILFFACLVFLFPILTIGLGAMKIPLRDIWRILASKIPGNSGLAEGISRGAFAVVWELRFPRILCGLLAGAGLAVAGVIFQGILQTPLADPYTLGISSGAAFGASLAILLNINSGLSIPVSLLALVFASLTLALVTLIAGKGGGLSAVNLIIAGIIVSAILQAGISFIKMLSGENVGSIVFWLMGSLSARGWKDVTLLALVIPAAAVLAGCFAGRLNILSLGSREAESLGVNVRRTQFFYLVLGASITAVCVSVCGIIGFVGLIVPHLLRYGVTSDNRLLVPLSGLCGALLLAAADTCVRILLSGEIPVGVLTTLLGGPFFIYIFIRKTGTRFN